MSDYSFSIIIPYYYLYDSFFTEALRSVMEQTYSAYECVIVYAQEDKKQLFSRDDINDDKIVLVECNSLGQGPKRNAGIKACKNQYLLFLDCDDMLNKDILSYSNRILFLKEVDLIAYGVTRSKGELNKIVPFPDLCLNLESNFVIFSPIIKQKNDYSILWESSCAKVFKKATILTNNVEFKDISCAEDALFVREFGLHASNVFGVIGSSFYYWRPNPNSTMHNIFSGFFNIKPFVLFNEKILEKINCPTDCKKKYYTKVIEDREQRLLGGYYSKVIDVNHFIYLNKKYEYVSFFNKYIKLKYIDSKAVKIVLLLFKFRMHILLHILLPLIRIIQ